MGILLRSRRHLACLFAAPLALALCGCGGGHGMTSVLPISVSLVDAKVIVMQAGSPVIVQIKIDSTSETALVSATGLPGDVQEKYAASDTNPSGTLTFTAGASAPLGTYMPTVTANSAGQTASTMFTLVVEAKSKMQ